MSLTAIWKPMLRETGIASNILSGHISLKKRVCGCLRKSTVTISRYLVCRYWSCCHISACEESWTHDTNPYSIGGRNWIACSAFQVSANTRSLAQDTWDSGLLHSNGRCRRKSGKRPAKLAKYGICRGQHHGTTQGTHP